MDYLLVVLIIVLASSSSSSLAYSDIGHPRLNNATDQRSLLDFKAAITHDPRHSLADWNPNISFCGWTGVTCSSREQRVVALNLSGMALKGSVSPSLANLSLLQFLALRNNSLQGNIPPQLGRLSCLKYLGLSMNGLEGHIPAPLCSCRNLVFLSLSYNFLSGSIPAEVGLLPRLKILYLAQNNLTGSIPSSLGNLSALTELGLDRNQLEGTIPQELGMLTNLFILTLSENQLIGSIPSSLGNLSALTGLGLGGNHLKGAVPQELGMLANLSILSLYDNHLNGHIPSSLSNISTLTGLDISANSLTGVIPQELGLLSKLEVLQLFENQLTGQIAASLCNCTSLRRLALYANQLSGHIPMEFGNKLLHLQKMYVGDNELRGNIPSSLGNCSKLRVLEMSFNQLSGEVPIELGKLSLLEILNLRSNGLVSSNALNLPFLTALTNCSFLQKIGVIQNQLGGKMPVSVGRLSAKLTVLALESNRIGGNIPDEVGNLTNLIDLYLSNNLFTGEIPSALKRLKSLERLSLNNNRLRGVLFSEIDEMESLGLLSINNNMLSGRIPNSLCHLQQLRRVYLHHNHFSGNIPSSMGECQILELLDLSHNKFTGNIPREVASLQNLLFYLNLSSNSLQGPLPPEIGKITMALAIDISTNKLSGIIPETLGSCTALEYLNLSQNALQGQIPTSLSKLQNIQVVDLSSNFLSSMVPKSFKRLVMLHYINLSFNNLSGQILESIFANSTTIALFEGNLGLCGLRMYSLPACPRQRNRRVMKIVIATIVSISVFVLCCLILGFIFFKRHELHKQRINLSKLLSTIAKNTEHPKISYHELVAATNGFSEANLLGVGSFGSVFKGILSDGTIVAIKVFNLQNEEAHKSFDRECKVLRTIRHRNLVRIITSCSNFDFKCLVMQFMPNGSLEKHLYPNGDDNDPGSMCGMSLSKRLDIAIDIAHGMSYLHHDHFMQVVHCDLKPNNLLLDDNMMALVTDFGIAQLVNSNSMDLSTSTFTLKGSIGYIAPEYGFGTKTSTNGDVYSFGIVLLEMLTRKKPINDMFVDGLNLPKWVSMAFPDRILEVVDSALLMHSSNDGMDEAKIFNCLVEFLHLGLLCTNESPNERPNMREITRALERIKGTFVGTGRASLLQSDISYLLYSQIVASTTAKALESQSSSTF